MRQPIPFREGDPLLDQHRRAGGAAKGVGGAAKVLTLTMKEWGDALDHVYDMGVQSGLEAAERLSYISPTCPMCKLKEEHDALARRLAVKENPDRGHQRRQSW